MKILPKILPKIQCSVLKYSGSSGSTVTPPIFSLLLLWMRGGIISGADVKQDPDVAQEPDVAYQYYRRDLRSGLHMFITPNGDTITGEWDTLNATYAIHDILLKDTAEIVAADALGTGPFLFDASGDSVERTMDELLTHAGTSDIMFFCLVNGEYTLRHYSEILTGANLIAADAWCDRILLTKDDGTVLTKDDGTLLTK